MSETVERAREASRRLKIFPLPSVVLLPGSALPLHIFEPRYRELIKDAVEGDKIFAMAQVVPGQEGLLPKAPELEPMLCVGTVAMHEPLPDGRSTLVLIGVARARIIRELVSGKPYREVEAELIVDASVPLDDPDELLLRQALMELIARVPTDVGERIAQVTGRVHGGALADLVASTVMEDVIRRYEVLCELDVRERMRVVAEETLLIVGGMAPRKHEGLPN
jgi:Lon protease-like protein